MTALLDVNVLIALVDRVHAFHRHAHHWFAEARKDGWATCPITENGMLRIIGNPGYPGSPGSPAMALPLLQRFRAVAGHIFWSDDLSLLTSSVVDATQIRTSAQLTDTYLLALAVTKGGRLATFDRRLSTAAVAGGAAALEIIA